MLAQEPWCYSPEVIGRLTDAQILTLYVEPARRRAEELERAKGGTPAPLGARRGAEPEAEPGSPGHRAQVVRGMVQVMGWSPERAAAEYDRQLALWKAERG